MRFKWDWRDISVACDKNHNLACHSSGAKFWIGFEHVSWFLTTLKTHGAKMLFLKAKEFQQRFLQLVRWETSRRSSKSQMN